MTHAYLLFSLMAKKKIPFHLELHSTAQVVLLIVHLLTNGQIILPFLLLQVRSIKHYLYSSLTWILLFLGGIMEFISNPGRCWRTPYTVVNDCFLLRLSPYTTRRYMIVILDHVNRRISSYTIVYDRACLT